LPTANPFSIAYANGIYVTVGANGGLYSNTGNGTSIDSDWTTSVGQAAELDKSISGTGTYGSSTGSVMTVNDSNFQWVEDENQRATSFFAKPATNALNSNKAAHVTLQAAIDTAFTNYPTNVAARINAVNSTLSALIASGSVSSSQQAALEAVVAEGLSI
jgi:hypothetical protein